MVEGIMQKVVVVALDDGVINVAPDFELGVGGVLPVIVADPVAVEIEDGGVIEAALLGCAGGALVEDRRKALGHSAHFGFFAGEGGGRWSGMRGNCFSRFRCVFWFGEIA